jgi:hypothetical protein
LQYAESDAQLVAEFFQSSRGGLVPNSNITLLLGKTATTAAMRNYLSLARSEGGPQDVLIIYYSGHTAVDKPGDYCLMPYDADPQDPRSTGIPMSELREFAQSVRAKAVVIFLDTAHAGSLNQARRTIAAQSLTTGDPSVYALLASRANDFSYEAANFSGGHGAFTYFLINGLNGAADSNKDGIVEFAELADYVVAQVRSYTQAKQIPQSLDPGDPLPLSYANGSGFKLAPATPLSQTQVKR